MKLALAVFALTEAAFVLGMSGALGWPLSPPNLSYAWESGLPWATVGAAVVGALHRWSRPPVAAGAAMLWVGLCGVGFALAVAAAASC